MEVMMRRISKRILMLLMMVSMMQHSLVAFQIQLPPNSGAIIAKKLLCNGKCMAPCIPFVFTKVRMALCVAQCVIRCLRTPNNVVFDCTAECARPVLLANINLDAENGDQMEQVRAAINSCHGTCTRLNQKPSK